MVDSFSFTQSYPIDLDTGASLALPVDAEFLLCESIVPSSAKVIAKGNTLRSELKTGRRIKFSQRERGRIEIENRSGAPVSLELSLGSGEITDSAVYGNVNAAVEPSDTLTPSAEVAINAGETKLLISATADRKEVRIGVKSIEANGVYIGNASVGAGTEGGYIEEGSVEYIASNSAVYGYNPGAGSINVNVLELRKS